MMFFKSCPRCRGDMHSRADIYGYYKECLQCGFMKDLARSEAEHALTAVRVVAKAKRRAA